MNGNNRGDSVNGGHQPEIEILYNLGCESAASMYGLRDVMLTLPSASA